MRSPVRRSARRGALVGAGAIVLGALTACSSDPIERYCEQVKEQQTPLTEAAASGGNGLLLALPSFEALRADAPPDIEASWAIVVQRITVLKDALDDAGVDPATYDPEQPPADLSEEEQAAIAAAASGLLTQATTDALTRVQQQARDVCKTPLSL